MLSGVLKSKRAVQVNVEIVRAFVRLRRLLASNAGWPANWKRLSRSTTASPGRCSTRSVD